MRPIILFALALVLLAPAARAGTAEAPELTDAAGDCEFALGNEYADVVAAWISDETAASFNANIALNKWTADALGEFTGYTLQFQHQGKQFGVTAFYAMGEWTFENAYINLEDGSMSDFSPAQGSFTPGSPALLTISFDKGHFPHGDASDNALRGFQAGTADFKYYVPWGFAGQDPPVPSPMFACDIARSDATYEFTVGGHSMHDPSAGANETASDDGAGSGLDADANASDDVAPLAESPGGKESPGFAAVAAVLAALAAGARRRR